jgi:hypothetical protein
MASRRWPAIRHGQLAVDWSTQMQGVYANTQTVSGAGDCSTHALCHRPNLASAIAQIEPEWKRGGENIGTGFSVDSLHTALMESPGHFANIIGDYNRLGVGVVNDGDGRIWVSFDFLKGPAITSSEPMQSQPLAVSPHASVVTIGTDARFNPVTSTRVVDTRSHAPSTPAGRSLPLVDAGATGRR